MTFESEGLLIVAIYIWLPPASYVVFLTTLVVKHWQHFRTVTYFSEWRDRYPPWAGNELQTNMTSGIGWSGRSAKPKSTTVLSRKVRFIWYYMAILTNISTFKDGSSSLELYGILMEIDAFKESRQVDILWLFWVMGKRCTRFHYRIPNDRVKFEKYADRHGEINILGT